jgi:hypothetical protein
MECGDECLLVDGSRPSGANAAAGSTPVAEVFKLEALMAADIDLHATCLLSVYCPQAAREGKSHDVRRARHPPDTLVYHRPEPAGRCRKNILASSGSFSPARAGIKTAKNRSMSIVVASRMIGNATVIRPSR